MDYLISLAADPSAWAALVTLIVMEVVLGIDNLIFIAILTNKLPEERRASDRGLAKGVGVAREAQQGRGMGNMASIRRRGRVGHERGSGAPESTPPDSPELEPRGGAPPL